MMIPLFWDMILHHLLETYSVVEEPADSLKMEAAGYFGKMVCTSPSMQNLKFSRK
jgi:hypothetical protein